jgi:hypothetical protein
MHPNLITIDNTSCQVVTKVERAATTSNILVVEIFYIEKQHPESCSSSVSVTTNYSKGVSREKLKRIDHEKKSPASSFFFFMAWM